MVLNIRLRASLSFLLLTMAMSAGAFAQHVNLTVRFGIGDGIRTGSKFTVVRNGAPLKFLRPAPEVINEQLDFGNQYLLEFEKPGHVKKTIALNTANVPKEVVANGINLTLTVELPKAGEASSGDNFIRYRYDAASKGFIQDSPTGVKYEQGGEARKSAEELFDLITKEEEKEKQYKQHFVKEDALEGRKGEGSSEEEEMDEEERKAIEERKAETIRRAEAARAARIAEIEAQRMQSMSETEKKEVENLRKREEQQRKQIAELKEKEEARREQDRLIQEQTLKAAEARSQEEERRMKEAAAKQQEEERRRTEAAAKAELEKRKREARERFKEEQGTQPARPAQAAEERPMTIEEAGNVISRTEEIIQEDKRIIRQITIRRERHTFVYRQVKYDWGGVYYFKNDMDITKNDFEMETAVED